MPTPPLTSWTLSGIVRDSQDNAPLSTVTLAISDGPNAHRATVTSGDGRYVLTGLESGDFTVTVSRSGYEAATQVVTLARDMTLNVALTSHCTRPLTPALMASTAAFDVSFSWPAASGATSYALEVGTSPGAADSLVTTVVGSSHLWANVPPGTYYARLKAVNACGESGTSNERVVSVTRPAEPSGPSPSPSPEAPPGFWSGPLPPASSGSRPVCQAPLPSVASCVNGIISAPQAICSDRAFSCSTGSGSCSQHGGVYCWRQ